MKELKLGLLVVISLFYSCKLSRIFVSESSCVLSKCFSSPDFEIVTFNANQNENQIDRKSMIGIHNTTVSYSCKKSMVSFWSSLLWKTKLKFEEITFIWRCEWSHEIVVNGFTQKTISIKCNKFGCSKIP